MKYGFGEGQVQTYNAFPLGPQLADVELELVEYVETDAYKAIDFSLVRRVDGKVERLRDRVFEIDEERVKPKADEDFETAVEKRYMQFNTRLWHYAENLGIDREELNDATATAKNFKDLANKYCKLVNQAAKGKKLYMKTVMNRGFVAAPMFPPFLQPMEEGKTCTLAWSPWEKENNEKNMQPAEKAEKKDKPAEGGSKKTAASPGKEKSASKAAAAAQTAPDPAEEEEEWLDEDDF